MLQHVVRYKKYDACRNSRGLGSKWSTGALTKHPHPDVCDILDIDIEVEDVVGFIWVGVPMKVPTIGGLLWRPTSKVLR